MTKLFKNYNEAFYYQTKLNKRDFIPINEYETLINKEYNNEDEYIEVCEDIVKDSIYALHISESNKLINGFLPINELMSEIRSLKNYETYKKITDNKIKVNGIKTDSLLFENNKQIIKQIKNIFNLSDKIIFIKITC